MVEEKDRLLAALETIAKNTTPADANLEAVAAERDKYKALLIANANYLESAAAAVEDGMNEPDLLSRSKIVRGISQRMLHTAQNVLRSFS